MRLSLTGRHLDITPNLRQLVTRRLARVERLLNDSAVSAQVVLSLEKRAHCTEVIVHARGDHMLTAQTSAAGWTQSIGEAVEKIALQARKLKDKWRTRKRRATGGRPLGDGQPAEHATSAPVAAVALRSGNGASGLRLARAGSRVAAAPRIVRAKYPIEPMRLEDAALRISEVEESFLVFRHADTERLAILFERPDGRLGLIDPDL
jgi:putative sigma-54 modulation protein